MSSKHIACTINLVSYIGKKKNPEIAGSAPCKSAHAYGSFDGDNSTI